MKVFLVSPHYLDRIVLLWLTNTQDWEQRLPVCETSGALQTKSSLKFGSFTGLQEELLNSAAAKHGRSFALNQRR